MQRPLQLPDPQMLMCDQRCIIRCLGFGDRQFGLDQRSARGRIFGSGQRCGVRFLYSVTLERDWAPEEVLPLPKKPQNLPIILGPEEVQQFLGCVLDIKHHAILTTCYAAGLRISEAIQLKPTDSDSQRMVVRVEQAAT